MNYGVDLLRLRFPRFFRRVGVAFRGDSSFAACTNSASRRSLGTARTPRMTVLKCLNSGVESKDGSFINLPKRTCAFRAPASSCHSGTRLCLRLRLAGQFIIRQTLADNLAHNDDESFRIRQLAIVEPEALLIGVGLQVVRLHAHVGALQGALKQRPEVLQPVRVDNAIPHVGFRVVDDFVSVVRDQIAVGPQFVRIQVRALLNMVLNDWCQVVALAPRHDLHAGLAAVFTVTLSTKPLSGSLTCGSSVRQAAITKDSASFSLAVHVAELAANEALVGLNRSRQLFRATAPHRQPYTVEHEPRGFLGDAQVAGRSRRN